MKWRPTRDVFSQNTKIRGSANSYAMRNALVGTPTTLKGPTPSLPFPWLLSSFYCLRWNRKRERRRSHRFPPTKTVRRLVFHAKIPVETFDSWMFPAPGEGRWWMQEGEGVVDGSLSRNGRMRQMEEKGGGGGKRRNSGWEIKGEFDQAHFSTYRRDGNWRWGGKNS